MGFSDKAIEYTDRKIAGLNALLLNFAGVLEQNAKENAAWNDRTGHARQGIHSGVEDNGDNIVLYLAHGMEYGALLETGTGVHGPRKEPYIIRPRDKKALFFVGAPHPLKKVLHPGMKAQPIIAPTLDAQIPRFRDLVLEYWEDD